MTQLLIEKGFSYKVQNDTYLLCDQARGIYFVAFQPGQGERWTLIDNGMAQEEVKTYELLADHEVIEVIDSQL